MSVFTHKTGGFETIHLLYGIRKERCEVCTYYLCYKLESGRMETKMKYLKPKSEIVLSDRNIALTLESVPDPGSEGGIIEEDDGTEQNSLPYM